MTATFPVSDGRADDPGETEASGSGAMDRDGPPALGRPLSTRSILWATALYWLLISAVFHLPALFLPEGPSPWWSFGYLLVGLTGGAFSVLLQPVAAAKLRPGLRLWAVAAATIGAAAAQSLVDHLIYMGLRAAVAPELPVAPLVHGFSFNLCIYLPIYGLYMTALGLMISRWRETEHRLQLAESQAARRQAELTALRLQISPHFLLNAFNASAALITDGRPKDAEVLLLRLAEFFRWNLAAPASSSVTLDQEFDTLSAYLEIEAIRFGDRLRVVLDLPPVLRGATIPHFVVQPLAENAVKHGVERSTHAVTVRITARSEGDTLVLSVTDDGRAVGPAPAPGGIGLQNIRGRLRTLFGDDAALEAGPTPVGFRSRIRLPLAFQTS